MLIKSLSTVTGLDIPLLFFNISFGKLEAAVFVGCKKSLLLTRVVQNVVITESGLELADLSRKNRQKILQNSQILILKPLGDAPYAPETLKTTRSLHYAVVR